MKQIRLHITHPSEALPMFTTLMTDKSQEVNLPFIHIAVERYLRERLRQNILVSRQTETARGFEGYIYKWDLAKQCQEVIEGKLAVSFEVEIQAQPFVPSMEDSQRLLDQLPRKTN